MLNGVSLAMFTLPTEDMTKYYRYQGSLTTPSCAEAVIFSLFEEPIFLSKTQVTDVNFVTQRTKMGTNI